MFRWLLIALLALPCLAAVKLYLKDGEYHTVREYEVKGDRVRYYSVERGDWEEIPLELVDLTKTKAEQAQRESARTAEAVALDAEDKAERLAAREIARVPEGPGVYWINGEELVPLKQAESKVVTDKKRSLLSRVSPIPIITGKSTVELDGEHSAFIVTADRPEFYFRIAAEERFAIAKMEKKKGVRVVEKWTVIPVSKELIQEHTDVEIFRHQVGDGLYKIWPQQPLEPGEYAVIEYTEGKGNTQVWDFACRAAAKK